MSKQKKRWTAAYAGTILDRADRARSDSSYAASRGLNGQRLSWWRKRLGRPRRGKVSATTPAEVAFVEVATTAPWSATTVEVLLANGRQLRVSNQIAPHLLAQIAAALESTC